MVRNGQSWDLGEPELNERGQPIIHNIATKLGCIRPNADADLPPHSVFPEDEAGLAKLAAELDVQQQERETHSTEHRSETDSNSTRTDRASSSELDHSDFEQDYRKVMLGGQNLQTMSPQSLTYDLDTNTIQSEIESPGSLFAVQSPSAPSSFPTWNMSRPSSIDLSPQFIQGMDIDMAEIMLSQGLVESEFGTIKPHMIQCPNPEVMLGVGDPMIYSGYNMESLRSWIWTRIGLDWRWRPGHGAYGKGEKGGLQSFSTHIHTSFIARRLWVWLAELAGSEQAIASFTHATHNTHNTHSSSKDKTGGLWRLDSQAELYAFLWEKPREAWAWTVGAMAAMVGLYYIPYHFAIRRNAFTVLAGYFQRYIHNSFMIYSPMPSYSPLCIHVTYTTKRRIITLYILPLHLASCVLRFFFTFVPLTSGSQRFASHQAINNPIRPLIMHTLMSSSYIV